MGKKGFVGAVKGKNDDIRKLVEGEVPDVPKEVKEELVKKLAEDNSGVDNKGTRSTVKTNLVNEIDITPSSNHSTTTKNPGYKGTPNSSIDIIDDAGNVQTRRWFGPDGKAIKDVDMTNHGNPKYHPEWPHEHFWEYGPDGKPINR
jgi:hypothetical protein